ncbi:DUF4134 family protein [Larkinella sp. GY13]|uniref:DUF4134 family protein n=1 Tax=Larkinella sp. GY13 TaxID=3453720 RepID=UPI003EE9969E
MKKLGLSTAFTLIGIGVLYAQTNGIARGATALDRLTTDLEAYLDPVTTVLYVVAAIVGVIGAFRVYTNWQQGKDNVMSGAMGWFGAMLFLLVANTVVRAMFIG